MQKSHVPAAKQTEETARERVTERARRADVQIRNAVEAHPVAMVAAAVAVGYVVGRLFRRR